MSERSLSTNCREAGPVRITGACRRAAGMLSMTGIAIAFLIPVSLRANAEVTTNTGIVTSAGIVKNTGIGKSNGIVATAATAMASGPVKGRVVDAVTGKPLAGASVTIKGKKGGVSTDEDGRFTLTVPSGKTIIIISSVGYAAIEKTVEESSAEIAISLTHTQKGMDEVVVTALGIQRSAKSLTYATQRIGGDQINQVRDANFTNTLSGKIAGLTVTPSANGPGGATRILLRGNRSIQGVNNALIVVDGVAIDNQTIAPQVADDQGSTNMGQSGSDGVSNVNPDDIESINVLKGAAGAALYGSRAANGVIMITTKKGKSGLVRVNLNSGVSVDKAFSIPKLQNQYSQGAGGVYSTAVGTSWGAKIAGQSVTDWRGQNATLQAYPNNIKDFFRSAVSGNNAISASGGSEKVQTYVSYANNDDGGIVPHNHLLRNTFDGRININITDRLSADAKITYLDQNIYDKPGVGGNGLVTANIYRIPRSVNLNDLKTYQSVNSAGIATPIYWTSADPVYMNPYWTINNTHHDENRSRITGLMSLKYKLTDWLNLQGRVSSDSYNDFITQIYANNTYNYARQPGGFYSEETDFVSERNYDVLLNGVNKLGSSLKLTYNLGSSLLDRGSRRRVMAANGLAFPNKFDLGYATTLQSTTATVKRELQSVYGTVSLSYRDMLFLDVTARNDWSSTLPEPYSYFYPSVGLTAILSDMLTMPSWITLGKVRASVTKVGNDAPPYLLAQNYSYITGGFGGYIASSLTQSIGGLKPELTSSIEAGTEWRFLSDRLGFDLTYYKTNSKNQLLNVQTPASSGYTSKYINAGNIQNQGVELMLNGTPVKSKDFSWDLGLNFALNKNKVIEAYGETPFYLGTSATFRTVTPQVVTGGSYGDLYGYKWQRQNGQFVVDANGLPVTTTTPEKVGNFNPDFTLGLTNTFTYKNWYLSFLIDGKFGGVINSGTAGQLAYAGTSAITTKYRDAGSLVLPGVTAGGTQNTVAIDGETFWQAVAPGGDYNTAEFFTYKATNVRVRELSLGYDIKGLPSAIKGARLSFVARNLFFIYRGNAILDIPGFGKRKMDFDPESSLGNSNYQGVEYYNLPTTRSYGLNLKLSF